MLVRAQGVNRRGVPTPIGELAVDLPNDGGVKLGV